jgi:hypothetical protein
MGPQSARSYPRRRLVKPAGPKAQRAKQEIDYGRCGIAGHVFGEVEVAPLSWTVHPSAQPQTRISSVSDATENNAPTGRFAQPSPDE